MSRRSGSIQVEVCTSVQVSEVLFECSDAALVEEAVSRGLMVGAHEDAPDLAELAQAALRRGDLDEADLLLTRLLLPKWRKPSDCMAAFAKRNAV